MIEEIKKKVTDLLSGDESGHGLDHINRVLNLSLMFCEAEKANREIVALIALLHDVDDYKLFGKGNSENLTNAKKIMQEMNISEDIQNEVCKSIKRIGYNKILNGQRPENIEGMIVSDADLCDTLGATGILRVYTYGLKTERVFFDKNIFPLESLTAEKYRNDYKTTTICHFFEKILKLKDLMLTEAGKKEAEDRHKIIVDFLYHLFKEENAPEWTKYLDNYLKSSENDI